VEGRDEDAEDPEDVSRQRLVRHGKMDWVESIVVLGGRWTSHRISGQELPPAQVRDLDSRPSSPT
jgi:hypothetical protein